MISYPRGVRGVRTRMLEAGRSGAAMLLLHGVGARADRWRENVDPLAAAGHHVYALPRRTAQRARRGGRRTAQNVMQPPTYDAMASTKAMR